MGGHGSKSDLNSQRRRRPSIHSGRLYEPTQPTITLSSCTSPKSKTKSRSRLFLTPVVYDDDFDKSASDLKENLPDKLKIYSNSIETIYRFWIYNIETLNEDEFKEASVLFYMNVFKLIPEARKLFKKSIELQSQQFFGMFRWLITNLAQPKAGRLIKRIKILGKAHKKMNIRKQWYLDFLQAFHDTMIEATKLAYTARIRFCMEQLYTVVMNVMIGNDFESQRVSSEKMKCLLKSLNKLEHCLESYEGRNYLKMYMEGQFCVELILFYQEYRNYQAAMNHIQREMIGKEIMKRFIYDSGECEINISYGTKNNVFKKLEINNNSFTEDLFDQCANEIIELIRMNIWTPFKKSIKSMTVQNNEIPNQTPTINSPYSTSSSLKFKFQ